MLSLRRLAIAPMVVALLLSGCGGDDTGGDDAKQENGASGPVLTVAAASSFRRPLERLARGFTEADVEVKFEFGTSKELSERLQDDVGEVDVYIGDGADVQAVAREERGAGEVRRIGRDLLQIVVASDAASAITGIADFAKTEPALGLCEEDQSCGRRARTALERAGVEAAIDASEPSATTLLDKIAAGELDAGIADRSTIMADDTDVATVAIPDEVNVITIYAAAALKGEQETHAQAFVRFLLSDEAKKILEQFGFLP